VSRCLTRIDFRLIGLEIALSEQGRFRAAADAGNLSQPRLSRGIAQHERSLGVSLFDRTTKGVVPAALGRMLMDRIEAVLRDSACLRRELDLLAGLETGAVSLAAASGSSAMKTTASSPSGLSCRCRFFWLADPGLPGRDQARPRTPKGRQARPRTFALSLRMPPSQRS